MEKENTPRRPPSEAAGGRRGPVDGSRVLRGQGPLRQRPKGRVGARSVRSPQMNAQIRGSLDDLPAPVAESAAAMRIPG